MVNQYSNENFVQDVEVARVLLLGFEDQENLGLRYISSRLKQHGHRSRICKITEGIGYILQIVQDFQPNIIGFSLIYQYLIPQFSGLIKELRRSGINAHFTMGGHYASFEYTCLLETIPGLDSVVCFEGEDTLVDLANCISKKISWFGIPGIAWRNETSIEFKLRPGHSMLDDLPWPDRDDIPYQKQAVPTASFLGSRGCVWNCSFCSINKFYCENKTRGRRFRDPKLIVDELEYLHKDRGIKIINWQDDDFLAGGPKAISWAHEIASESIKRNLHKELQWKISCRSDEIKPSIIEPLIDAGLRHFYLGVEAGDENDLKHLNKHLTPESHLNASRVIKDYNLSFDFGFMILNPWSTFQSVQNNLNFLRELTSGGESVICFCRTLPYAGTDIKKRLQEEGRLEDQFNADYHFLDPRLDKFYDWMLNVFNYRNNSNKGTLYLLRLLLIELRLNKIGYNGSPEILTLLKHLVELDNDNAIGILEEGLDYFQNDDNASLQDLP